MYRREDVGKLTIAANQNIKEKEYWLQKLSGEPVKSRFPYDHRSTGDMKRDMEKASFKLSGELYAKLLTVSGKSDHNLHMILTAGLTVLLYKYTGDTDIIIGTPTFTKDTGTEYLNRVLALRSGLKEGMTFKEVLLQVRETIQEAVEFQNYPIEILIEQLYPGETEPGDSFPLFDISLVLENIQTAKSLEHINTHMTFSFLRTGETIEGSVVYNSFLYTKTNVEHIVTHFNLLLQQVLFNVSLPLFQASIVSQEEQLRLLFQFNDTQEAYPGDKTIHLLFEEQAEKVPDHTAVVFDHNTLTYRELNLAANRLAALLRKKGVAAESIIAILMDYSLEMIFGILGILKAGCAYLPITPSTPYKRIMSILDDSNAQLVITNDVILKREAFSFITFQGFEKNKSELPVTPPRPQVEDLDRLQIPDRSLVNYEKYSPFIGQAAVKNFITINMSRGCVYKCAFCFKIWPNKYVTRSAENIFEEIYLYYKMGVRRFAFVDDLPNINIPLSSKLMRLIISKGLKVHLHFPNGIRGDILTKDYIDLMVEAGTITMDLALETTSPRLQKLIHKNLNLERLYENIRYITEKHPHVILETQMLHGIPTETEEEAIHSLEYIKSQKWFHFPYIHILNIYPDSEMARIAVEHGVPIEAIENSADLAYHELPETLPFPKSFTRKYQSEFMNRYFLSKDRLLAVLPHQMKVLTEDELVQKYNSYLPVEIKSLSGLLDYAGISRRQIPGECLPDDYGVAANFNEKLKKHFQTGFESRGKNESPLKILLLDLSQFFSTQSKMVYDVVEVPLGLLYLLTHLNREFGDKIVGKIAKARIDFDSFEELKAMVEDFKPDVIGIRTLNFYKDFFHKTVSLLRQWGIDAAIVTGGPYATSSYRKILMDDHIDLVVVGEGEITFNQLIGRILENGGKLPDQKVLAGIRGIAFKKDRPTALTHQQNRDILMLDHLNAALTGESRLNPAQLKRSAGLAYIIYTSGSTGTPKGVMVQHNNLVNQIVGLQRKFHLDDSYHYILLAQFNFDVSVMHIFSALTTGAKLFLVKEETKKDPVKLWDFIYRHKIDILNIVPAFLSALIENIPQKKFHFKCLFIGGDVFTGQLYERLQETFNAQKTINIYGPTEATINTTLYPCKAVEKGALIPIGKPLMNYSTYILDRHSNLVPVGVKGELCISGEGVARGYLNCPELTAEKLVPLSSSYPKTVTIYKTGDLARWRADGNIEFIERIDQQVKVRGFRIQLEEIEHHLRKYPGIEEAVVLTRADDEGEKYLCAYVVPSRSQDIPSCRSPHTSAAPIREDNIREYLSKELPDYMIPSYFIRLDRIPLNSNGKIDHAALKEYKPGIVDGTYVPPGDKTEAKLVEIWSDLLGIEPQSISIDGDFFKLGGHSLKASILGSRIHKEFQVKVELVELFKNPTIMGLVDYIKQAAPVQYSLIKQTELKEYYPLSSAQQRLFVLQQLAPEDTRYNMPRAVILEGTIDKDRMLHTLEKLVKRHESFRTSFLSAAGEPVQRVHEDVEVKIESFTLRPGENPGNQSRAVAETVKHFMKAFDLSVLPLFRVGLIRLADEKHVLMVDMHHIITDGTSDSIFIKDFMALYDEKELPPLNLQYKDYAEWEARQKENQSLSRQAAFWQKEFPGEVPVLELPTDFSRPPVLSFAGNTIGFTVDREKTRQLRLLASETESTLYMVLLAVYNIFLARLSGMEDIIIGTVTAGRRHPDLEKIVGMFVNTLALRNFPAGTLTVNRFLARTKEKTLTVFENQDYPLEELLKIIRVNRDTRRNPLFDVTFGLHNHEKSDFEIPGLRLKPYDYEHRTSKFDLTLQALEVEDRLEFTFEYSVRLFKTQTIERFIVYFNRLVSAVLADPGKTIAELEMIPGEEKRKLLENVNNTRRPYPADRTIHRLFEEEVEKVPDAIAAIYEDRQITYHQLNRDANRLARILRRRGVSSQDLVGIMIQHSLDMVTGVLAILKAGGAYLPIDQDYPKNRILSMLEDSGTSIVLTTSAAAKKLSFTALQTNKTVHVNPLLTGVRPQIKDLDHLPIPDRSLVNYEKYNKGIGMAMAKHTVALQASRGCPYKCVYCHKIWPKSHIVRSAEHILDEVKLYYEMGVRRFIFVDDIFNLNRENSSRFFESVIKSGMDVQIFFPNGMRGDILTRQYIDLMSEAGVVNLALALETASPRLQKLIGKNINLDKLHDNMDYICRKHPHIISELFTMHGFPTETEEEALQTLDFIKSLKWLHLPHVNILKIYPNTDMAKMALENGVSMEAIIDSENLAYHELPDTLPFDKNFTLKYQTDYFNNYFMSKERLTHVLPYKMKVLTEDEIVQKYNSFLPTTINSFDELLQFAGIDKEKLASHRCLAEERMVAPDLNRKMRDHFPAAKPQPDALRVLLLDLSQYFSGAVAMLYDVVEPPLGLMYLMTYLNKEFGDKINGKIAKSRIDFDSFAQLRTMLEEFKPDVIGLRTLTFYKEFFHETAAMIRQWGFDGPVCAGGPYASSDFQGILQDRNIDVVVLGEGEITFGRLIRDIMENNGKLPDEKTLKDIPGLVFVPGKRQINRLSSRHILLLDEMREVLSREPGENPENVNQPGDLVYTMFTSGSTGRPKGVMVEHRNVVRLVKNTNFITFKTGDRILQTGALEFDASTFEIWGALLNRLVLYPGGKNVALEPAKLKEVIRKHKITTMWMTAPLFNQISDIDIEIFDRLDNLLVGGDALSSFHINRLIRQFPRLKVINGYGPTENTTFSTTFLIQREYEESIPIGTPIANSTAYVVDKYNYPVPLGVRGELLVGGDGVSRGYLNNPELTAEKFVPFNPSNRSHMSYLTDSKQDRLYKTGDMAKFTPDGTIEFYGRRDHQVKIRGYRVELTEIEERLLKHPQVKSAVVVPRAMSSPVVKEEKNRDNFLCCYWVLAADAPTDARHIDAFKLKNYLFGELPDYMVPGYFMQMEKMPLTPNGKVDRKALPLPGALRGGQDYTAPGDEIEEKLVTIWSEILQMDKNAVGTDDDFFELGGHSLRATLLLSRIHKELKVKIPLTEIFTAPTIKRIAAYIKEALQEQFVSVDPAEKKEYYTLSSAQERLHILYRMNEQSLAYNSPIFTILEGGLEQKKLEDTFRQLINRHESLRTSIRMISSQPVQQVHHIDDVAFEVEKHRVEGESNEKKVKLTIDRFIRPFDLAQAPLMRVATIKLEEKKHILAIDMHHIIADGFSLNIFVKEFMGLYNKKKMPRLNLHYKDFAQWQRKKRSGELFKKQERFWLGTLGSDIPLLNLPTDFPRPAVLSFEGSSLQFRLGPQDVLRLRELTGRAGVTIYILLLAIYNVLLAKLSGQEDIVIGSPIAGRRHIDLEKIIGMYVNTLVLLSRPGGEKTFDQFLEEVKTDTLNAFENQDYQYEDLVEKLAVSRDTSRNPLFDVVFVLQNIDIEEIRIPGLKLTPYPYEHKTSKFDLILAGTEGDNSIGFSLSYSTKLFKSSTIETFILYYKQLIARILENPGQKISDLDIISHQEKARILNEFNNTGTPFPADKTLARLFEEQVEKTPDHIAVVDPAAPSVSITYRQLNERANRVAAILMDKGVKPGTVVAVMTGRSIQIPVGMLGILKAGGAYFPVNPSTPLSRITAMLNDIGVAILLTRTADIKGKSFTGLQNLNMIAQPPRVTASRPAISDFDSLAIPDRSLVDYEKYNRHIGLMMVKNSMSLQASRGCPFNCAFCHKIWPKAHLSRSAEHIFAEVALYYKMGVRRFSFVDDVFNLNVKNSTRLFQLIIEKGLDVQLFFGLRGDILTRDYIDLMVRAGTVRMALALETASPRLQKLIRKHLNIKKLRKNLEYISETYPHVILELNTMHGLPTETEDEARMTLDFIKSLKGLHFPYINILKIYPNTDMEKLALECGISREAIDASADLAYHELPETLPFEKSFSKQYQAEFLNDYFLSKERLLHVLPQQMKVLTEDELIRKYDSYLPFDVSSFDQLLNVVGIAREELGQVRFFNEKDVCVPDLNRQIKAAFPVSDTAPQTNALRVLLLDLSQYFEDSDKMLYDLVEPPIGLMYLLTHLKKQYGPQVKGKIAKSRIDFNNYPELNTLISDFKPDIIGIRTLTFYKKFFHTTVAMIRHWGYDGPVVAGGPYATSDFDTILQDRNIDLAVLGEGETTFNELVGAIIGNEGKLPENNVLMEIPGISFIPGRKNQTKPMARELLMLDALDLSGKSAGNPAGGTTAAPGDLAYIIFTSGSTGMPKGVMIENRNVVNVICWFADSYRIGTGTHVLQLTDCTFDASVNQIFSTLLHGGTLHLVNETLMSDINRLRGYIANNGIHILNFVPTLLHELLSRGPRIKSIRAILSGGERLNDEMKDAIIQRGYDLYNQYGPTESTIDALVARCTEEKVVLGKPIANTRCYILDKYGSLVPVGIPGEVYIAGSGLARGYLNRVELTNETFISCPFSPGEKMYKTGDLARWLPGGNVQFLGRIDNQVKIRGYRIELGEIESQLQKHKNVKEAVVKTYESMKGGNYLCAYIVAKNNSKEVPEEARLKEFLARALPDYMVPSTFTFLDEIPLLASGKIDRNALVEPGIDDEKHNAPQTAVEIKLVQLWAEALEIDKEMIRLQSNFFQLGGHSLKATILGAKINKEFNVRIPLVEIFKEPTITGLAQCIRHCKQDKYTAIKPVEKKEYYRLSSAQNRLYVIQRMDEQSTVYNTPTILELTGNVAAAKLEYAFSGLLQRHESLRTSFRVIEGETVQQVHDSAAFSIQFLDTGAEDEKNTVKNFIQPFDLSQPSQLRVGLIQSSPERNILIIDMHHIISDGTSHRIVIRELIKLYEGKKLPPLKLQYRDFSEWQRSQTQQAEIKRQEEYWLRQFEDSIPVLNIPTDYPRPAALDFEGGSSAFTIESQLTAAIKDFLRENDVTLNILMIAAYNILLAKYSAQEDILVGIPASGRGHVDLQDIIGFFSNMLPIRNRPGENKMFVDFLEEVKLNALYAYENQDAPFDELVWKLNVPRQKGRHPLIDTVLVVVPEGKGKEEEIRAITRQGLTLRVYEFGDTISHFDLMVHITEGRQTLNMVIEYRTALFKPATIEKMAARFIAVLEQVTEDNDLKLKEIAGGHDFLLAQPELARVYEEDWNL